MEDLTVPKGEEVLVILRKHWLIILREVAAVAIFAFVPFVFFALTDAVLFTSVFATNPGFYSFATLLWLLVTWLAIVAVFTRSLREIWILTDKRILGLEHSGLFSHRTIAIGYENVSDVAVNVDGALEDMFEYGRLEIQTNSDAPLILRGVAHPSLARTIIIERVGTLESLVEENRAQEKLLRTVSHEVKGYLARDAAALAEIAEGEYDKRPAMLKSFAGSALSQTRKGVGAMIHILDGGEEAVVKFNFAESLRTIVHEYEIAARKKGLTLSLDAPEFALVVGDQEKMERLVVRNLLDNALHYTPGGSIHISLSRMNDRVHLSVTDTGVGISESDMQHLFTEGGKGAHSSEINPESTGYGLAAAKEVVEESGGAIWAESEGAGEGSEFIVELPLA